MGEAGERGCGVRRGVAWCLADTPGGGMVRGVNPIRRYKVRDLPSIGSDNIYYVNF